MKGQKGWLDIKRINNAARNDEDVIPVYDVDALGNYLDREIVLFFVCYKINAIEEMLLEFMLSRFEIKPYGGKGVCMWTKWKFVLTLKVNKLESRMNFEI